MLRSEIAAVCLAIVGVTCLMTAFGLMQNGWRGAAFAWLLMATLVGGLFGSGYVAFRLGLLP